jgi:menaquinone-dependent protoporphyrinogen oxidase
MKIGIFYATTHGCTEKCALKLKAGLSGEIELFNIKKNPKIQIESYDTILIGGSIHAGRIQKSVQKFCTKHLDLLLRKKIGLFICCMEKGEKAEEQLKNAFPQELLNHAKIRGCFGGAFDFEKMNFIEKAIIKKVANIDQSISNISEESIQKFITEIQ